MSAKDIINTCGFDQITPEHSKFDNDIVTKAIIEDDVETVKMLISRDIRPIPNRKGQSGLFHCRSVKMCQVLLMDGASSNRMDKYNRPAMTYAIMNGHIDIAKMIAKHQHTSSNTIMTTALQTLSEPFIRYICNEKLVGPASVDHAFMNDCNLLHTFIIKRHTAMVRFLIDFGADPTMVNVKGYTPEKLSHHGKNPTDITFIIRNTSNQKKDVGNSHGTTN